MSRIDNIKEFSIRIYNEKDVNDYLIHDSKCDVVNMKNKII